MASTSNILAAFAIAFLACLSLSSALAQHNLDISNAFEDLELQPFLREKRQEKAEVFHLRNSNPLELEEELSEPAKTVYERRAVVEEAKDDGKSKEREKPSTEPKINNDIEKEEEDAQNATKSEKFSKLPKRQAVASATATASASSSLVGANLWDAVSLVDLDEHSCEVEAFSHGHFHVSGTIVHEFFCELRKFWHYGLIVFRNLKSGLTFGPLIAGDIIHEGLFSHLFHHTSRLFDVIISEPHHLLILPDIIRDAVPLTSVTGACHRFKHVFFKVLHFGLDLFRGHVRHVLAHLFSHPHLGVHLRERLHHLHRFGSILPLEEIVAEPIVSTAAAAATATATATATTTSTATTSSDSSIIVPDYHRSLAEVLSSFRGFYDGYHASGLAHLIRTGARSISMSSAFPRISSCLSPFFSHFTGYGPVEQSTTVTTASSTSSTSSSIGGIGAGSPSILSPVIEPTIVPVAPPVPVVPIQTETASSTASATATATATIAETQPVFSAEPTIIPSVIPCDQPISSGVAASAAAATATAAAVPVVSSYPTASLIQPVPTLSPAIVSNTVSESSSVVVAAPEAAVLPTVLEGNGAAAASATAAAAAASSAANVFPTSVVGRAPIALPLRRHRPRPILSTVTPATAAAAASASASTGGYVPSFGPARYRGLDLDIDRRIRYPSPIRSQVFPAVIPSSAVTSSTAAAAAAASTSSSSAAASSSASSISSGGFNFVLPREQIIGALGHDDYLLPGDVVVVNLRNKSRLFGRVLDATSPVTFGFLQPKMRASLLRHGGRVWNLLPRDFRDPECFRKFNNPLLLRHGI
ncbi:PREDICTED: uncharacterized protein LOC105448478 isoform X2 [Wasmannia auropunctata]|uniref:uncharacterized protein LOC105448478 isoform X2 n=1 Tax=Wasmannia auropunctata TaxID=64793 RepID=UPI0005F08E58|nr:PREDICTED: uncharacterized protein LOC105448478 isoform X2 [Wasmannia auropunctata]